MIIRHWNVLVVDDEPDVISVTKLAFKRLEVYGRPIKLATCSSKAEAIEYFKSHDASLRTSAALIDVVMESDQAGLELCQYIRQDLGNHTTPLIVRTGQAGRAPEKEVIDRYDISGYLSKVDATNQRLYSVMKTSIRNWYAFYFVGAMQGIAAGFLRAARKTLLAEPPEKRIPAWLEDIQERIDWGLRPDEDASICLDVAYLFGDECHVGTGTLRSLEASSEAVERLEASGEKRIMEDGNYWIHHGDKTMFVALARDNAPVVRWIFTVSGPSPEFLAQPREAFVASVQSIWSLLATSK